MIEGITEKTLQLASRRQFGKYTVLDCLGTGGMGAVYLVLANDTGHLSALKTLSGEVDKEAVRGFIREAELLAKLSTPYIEAFGEFVIEDEQRWLVKEFIDGVALRTLFLAQAGPLPSPITYHLALQILAGLEYLHKFEDPAHAGGSQLVHGDLSPNNVMVNFSGEVKLIDLGLSCFPRQNLSPTEPSKWLNVRYSSPDRLVSQRRSISDDLFAFGMILWDMLVGQPYWFGFENKSIYRGLREFSPRDIRELRPDLSVEVATLVRGCLWHENFYGFNEAAEVREALQAIIAAERASATKEDLTLFVQSLCTDEIVNSKRRQNIARLQITAKVPKATPPPAKLAAAKAPEPSETPPPLPTGPIPIKPRVAAQETLWQKLRRKLG